MRHFKVTRHALIERLLEDCSEIPLVSLSLQNLLSHSVSLALGLSFHPVRPFEC
jgi:hypothetical protein